jgi:hypothetical protein
MAKLDRIANVQIDLRTTAIKEQSFSDMIIVGAHVLGTSRTMIITEAGDLLDLGLSETDPLYFAARDAFAAIPSIVQVYIGRRQVDAVTLTVAGDPAPVVGAEYSATLSWKDGQGVLQTATPTYTVLNGDDAADVATGLAAAINATAITATAVAAVDVVTLTNDAPGAALAVGTLEGALTLAHAASTETPTVALNAALNEGDNWYGVVLADRSDAAVKDAMAWAEANEKLFATAASAAAIVDPGSNTDLGSYAKNHQYFRTAVMKQIAGVNEYPEATWMSEMFTFYPGTETWALKKLPGITIDPLSEGQAQAALAKNVSTFEEFRDSFAVTQGGKVAAGEWIDVIRFRDYLVDAIKVSVVSAMINADGKIPYTDPGIQIIGNAIRSPLDLNVRRGGIAPEELDADGNKIPSYVLNLPLSANVSFNDKANRVLNDVKFTARLSGAIHVVNIKGSLSYSL